jgi:hypothetical protein
LRDIKVRNRMGEMTCTTRLGPTDFLRREGQPGTRPTST